MKILKKFLFNNYHWLTFVIFVLVVYLLYSKLGYNPTDDGFIFAYGRRILAGEIPHRDFIAIRPVGSSIFHLPELVFAGQYLYLVSRLIVWFELAVISFSWVKIVQKLSKKSFSKLTEFALAILGFCFTVHTFPIMAFHTIDGLFFASLGIYLLTFARQISKFSGYFLLGFSFLCKQNFLLLPLAAILVFKDWKSWRNFLAMFLPGLIYLVWVVFANGFQDLYIQIFTQSDILKYGFWHYVTKLPFLYGILGGLLVSYLINLRTKTKSWHTLAKIFGIILVFGIFFWSIFAWKSNLKWPSNVYLHYAYSIAFLPFGLGVGLWLESFKQNKFFKIGFFALLIAWSVSISTGYNSPALGLGVVLIWIFAYIFSCGEKEKLFTFLVSSGLIVLTIATLVNFNFVRKERIYRETGSSKLTRPLGEVLAGGQGIYTNEETFSFFADLKEITDNVKDKKYAILPDAPGYWPKAPILNPLPLDWPNRTEMNSQTEKRLEDAVQASRGETIFIVQKYYADSLAIGLVPIKENDPEYPVLPFIRNTLEKIQETEYFIIYN